MASSNPFVQSVDLPNEVPPSDTFKIPVVVGQGDGPDPWLSSGGCTSQNLDITAWVTPVTLWVDGERVATRELCLANKNTKSTEFSLSIRSDSRVAVKVHPVGDVHPIGQTWEDNLGTVADDVSANISVSEDASDPSEDSSTGLLAWLDTAAKRIGTSVNMLAAGIVVAAIAFLLI